MKNYTNLEQMKSSELLKNYGGYTFTEEEVTEENFEEKKSTLYKAYEPPANAQMLKFRYYSPDKTLIEQNNVPVVYDGTSITDVINWYFLTDEKEGITFSWNTKETDGWSKEAKTVDADNRFLWCVTETRYSNTLENQAGSLTEPVIVSIYGEQGDRGAMYLGHYADGDTAYKENTPAIFTGDYYLNTTDGYIYVYDKDSAVWAKISGYEDYRYSIAMNDIIGALNSTQLETFVTAKTGWFENLAVGIIQSQKLFSKEITLVPATDSEGNTTGGGIIKSNNYASGTSGWQIDYNGNAEFNNATVRGTIYATAGEFQGAINAATITGGTISGAEISGGSITIGDNFKVTNEGVITATGGTFTNITVNGNSVLNGYLYSNSVPFILCAMINFRSQDMDSDTGIFHNYKTANIKSFKRRETGTYDVEFKNPITTKIFKAMGSDNVEHNYLTLLFLGNAHSSRDSFAHNCFLTTNFDLVSIDNMNKNLIQINEDSMTATVLGAALYCGDNNNDELVDFITIQGFFIGTEPVL